MTLKQTIQETNALLSEDVVQAILSLKSEEECKQGQYVWGKGHRYNITLTQETTGNPFTLIASSEDIDLSTVDSSFFVGMSGTYSTNNYPFVVVSETEFQMQSSLANYTYDSQTRRFTVSITTSNILEFTTNPIQEHICYVISDNPNEYPNGGDLEGFWYDKSVNVAVGSFTPSGEVRSLELEHGLGRIPKGVLITCKGGLSVHGIKTYHWLALYNEPTTIYALAGNTGYSLAFSGSCIPNDETINITTTVSFIKAKTYDWVVW